MQGISIFRRTVKSNGRGRITLVEFLCFSLSWNFTLRLNKNNSEKKKKKRDEWRNKGGSNGPEFLCLSLLLRLPIQNRTKQSKTKQNKQNQTKQNRTKQNKTKQNKTKQNKTNEKANLFLDLLIDSILRSVVFHQMKGKERIFFHIWMRKTWFVFEL